MRRFIVRCAVTLLSAAGAVSGFAQTSSVPAASCAESEVRLDAMHSVARLEGCSDAATSGLLWHLDRIDQVSGALDGHFDRRNGGAGAVIYVMDTGVMASHGEFLAPGGSRVIGGYDAAAQVSLGSSKCNSSDKATAPCFDDFEELAAASHGTGVASVAAGRTVGVAPEARVVSIRVMNERGLATTRTYLDGLDAIIRHAWSPSSPGFRTGVVNISGWVLERLTSRDAQPVVAYAQVEQKMRDMIGGVDAAGKPDPNGRRFVFVVAANNVDGGCGPSGVVDRFPATLGAKVEGMITVGGMTASNTSWSGSCRGAVEVLAPAQSIISATITAPDHYRSRALRSGTSFAAPIVSGIAARLLTDRPDITPAQIEKWIEQTPSRVIDPSGQYAEGRVAFVQSIAPPAVASAPARAALAP